MGDKFAEDTEEAVTWPIYQDMEDWNLLVNDEGRKYFQDGGWDYMLYCSFYDDVFMHGTLKEHRRGHPQRSHRGIRGLLLDAYPVS